MNKVWLYLKTLIIVSILLNNSVFSTNGFSKLKDEETEADSKKLLTFSIDDPFTLRRPLVVNEKQEIPTINKVIEVNKFNFLDSLCYLAQSFASPWLPTLPEERSLFSTLLLQHPSRLGNDFGEHYKNICYKLFKKTKVPVEDFIQCLDALEIKEIKIKKLIYEALTGIFYNYIEGCLGLESHSFEEKLSYLSKTQNKSLYAEYKLTIEKTECDLGKVGTLSKGRVKKDPTIRRTCLKAETQLDELKTRLPKMGAREFFVYLSMVKYVLGKSSESIALLREAIDRQYETIERHAATGRMSDFMETSNSLFTTLGRYCAAFARKELNTQRKQQIKYIQEASEIFEDLYEDQQLKQPDGDKFIRWYLYRELGQSEKEKKLFTDLQESRIRQIQEKQDALKAAMERRANAIKKHMQKNEHQQNANNNNVKQSYKNEASFQKKLLLSSPPPQEEMGSPQVFPNSSHEKQIDIPLKKEKRKTTGIPAPSKEKEERQEQPVELTPPQIKIEELLEKKYYNIFCRFFSEDEEEGPNKAQGKSSIKISTKELEKLLKRIEKSLSLKIDQKSQTKVFDPSKGKGSHAKGVIKNENKKVVMTVPKHPYLYTYQIEQWKQSFMSLGYYPEYLKDALEKKKILNEKKSEFWKNKN